MDYFERKIRELDQVDSDFASYLREFCKRMELRDIDNYWAVMEEMDSWLEENGEDY